MKRHVVAIALMTAAAAPSHAFDWPWADAPDTRYSYCKGFVVAALGELPVARLSRTDLWLSWNQVNREGIKPSTAADPEYRAGYTEFDQLLASGDMAQLRDVANGDCALGRN